MKLTNFRDIGGITTQLGKIKEKRLLRSGELFELSESDAKSLKEDYSLRLVLDLRSPNEFLQRPDTQIEGVRHLTLDIMEDLSEGNTGFDSLLSQLDLTIVDKQMKQVYRDIITNETASRHYKRFLEEIANLSDGAVLFHCYAGKDRTGLGAVLLLDTLKASKEDIIADYLLTNKQRAKANETICKETTKLYNLSSAQAEALIQFLLVKEDYIHETYRTIDETFGSVENYILNGLKVAPETLEKIRLAYLE